MSNLIGKPIGRYHILEQLGEGGMATVYKAYDSRLDREVAVKIIRKGAFPPDHIERILKRFEREAKALARLSHSNIIKILDYGEYESSPFLVMEYLPGGTLKQKMGRPIPWQEALLLLLPIVEALDYAHSQNMIHRDVKPANILLTQRGQPVLTDFGIAKVLDLEETLDLTGTSAAVGTPEYMAPEQATAKYVDHRADIYSLGVVLYEMITGRKPFIADTPMAVLIKHATEDLPRPTKFSPNLPDDVEKILLKALVKQPENRYQDMGELASVFKGALAEKVPVVQAGQERKTQEAFDRDTREKEKKEAEELSRQKTANEKVEREVAEKVAREKAEKDVVEKARLEAEYLTKQKIAKEKMQREAAEKVAREKIKKDAIEKARQQKADELAKHKATEEKAEREAIENATREKTKRNVIEKARGEKAERHAVRKAEFAKALSKSSNFLKSTLPKTFPFLKIAGFTGIAVALFWAGSWAVPKFIPFIPTPLVTTTQHPAVQITSTGFPVPLTKTPMPTATPTVTPSPTFVMPTVTLFTPIPLPYPKEIIDGQAVYMRLVPEGVFTMGSDSGIENEKPVHAVYMDNYYIDRFEVTNKIYMLCVDTGNCKPPVFLNYVSSPETDDYPVVHVNWDMAKNYCEWRGARLPTEAEWEKAARGTDGRIYPSGDSINCYSANTYGCNSYHTTKVGSLITGKSVYGIYDMAGNVWEWVTDWYSGTYYQTLPTANPKGPDIGTYRVLRGGSFVNNTGYARSTFRRGGDPTSGSDDVGFRCALTP